MAKVPRCNGCWWAIEKRMTVNKTTNTRKGVSVRVTTGGQLIKGNTKLKWTTFSASLPHTRFSKHQFQDKQLSLFLLSNRWYTGRERGSKRVFYLLVSSTAERFLWDPQHVQMVFELHLFALLHFFFFWNNLQIIKKQTESNALELADFFQHHQANSALPGDFTERF